MTKIPQDAFYVGRIVRIHISYHCTWQRTRGDVFKPAWLLSLCLRSRLIDSIVQQRFCFELQFGLISRAERTRSFPQSKGSAPASARSSTRFRYKLSRSSGLSFSIFDPPSQVSPMEITWKKDTRRSIERRRNADESLDFSIICIILLSFPHPKRFSHCFQGKFLFRLLIEFLFYFSRVLVCWMITCIVKLLGLFEWRSF